MNFPFLKAKERLIRIMGTFDLSTGHADTFDELLNSLESELRDVLGHYREAVKEPLTQEPVAYLVLFESAGQLLEFKKGNYLHNAKVKHIPLYTKTEIEIGCSECGIGGGHALYCVACAEKFVGGYKDSGVPAVETGLEQVSPDTSPQQRPWVGLTDEEREEIENRPFSQNDWLWFYTRAIEAKLKEKNK
jgi:hypothetical protein